VKSCRKSSRLPHKRSLSRPSLSLNACSLELAGPVTCCRAGVGTPSRSGGCGWTFNSPDYFGKDASRLLLQGGSCPATLLQMRAAGQSCAGIYSEGAMVRTKQVVRDITDASLLAVGFCLAISVSIWMRCLAKC